MAIEDNQMEQVCQSLKTKFEDVLSKYYEAQSFKISVLAKYNWPPDMDELLANLEIDVQSLRTKFLERLELLRKGE